MRQLSYSVTVKAPSSFALAYMNTFFLERGSQSGGAELPLRFPLPNLLTIDGLTIEKVVKLRLESRATTAGTGELNIGWEPLGTGPLPRFSGTLSAAGQAENLCRLTLAGSYAPPGGIAGALFDRLVGGRIARATVTALLASFGRSIEADYLARLVS